MDFSKKKIDDKGLDFLASADKGEYEQTCRNSRQSIPRNSVDIEAYRQSSLSDTWEDLGDLSKVFNVEAINDQKVTLNSEKQSLEKELQKIRQENSQLHLAIKQLIQKDKNKSQEIDKLKAQKTSLSGQLKKLSDALKQDKKQALITLQNSLNIQIDRLQSEVKSYSVRRKQFQDDMKVQVQETLKIKTISQERKNQSNSLQKTNLDLKTQVHELNICINAKKTLILAIQTELEPYQSLKEQQLVQQVRLLVQSFKRLTEETQKSSKAMVMIEKIIQQSKIKPKQIV